MKVEEMRRMNIELISETPNPERVIASAARLCYSDEPPETLFRDHEVLSDEAVGKLIGKLKANGHMSPFEHASFTFGIDGISRACSHQLVRHRIASFSQRSQRYCEGIASRYVTPDSISESDEANEVYLEALSAMTGAYRRMRDMGVPKEDARYILPNSMQTALVVTMNARELLHFFNLRTAPQAQWEIRQMATMMQDILRANHPVLFG